MYNKKMESMDLQKYVRETAEYFASKKDELLKAWFVEHGFAPGRAVFVEERLPNGGTKIYIREQTEEEAERLNKNKEENMKQNKPKYKIGDVLVEGDMRITITSTSRSYLYGIVDGDGNECTYTEGELNVVGFKKNKLRTPTKADEPKFKKCRCRDRENGPWEEGEFNCLSGNDEYPYEVETVKGTNIFRYCELVEE